MAWEVTFSGGRSWHAANWVVEYVAERLRELSRSDPRLVPIAERWQEEIDRASYGFHVSKVAPSADAVAALADALETICVTGEKVVQTEYVAGFTARLAAIVDLVRKEV